MGLLFYSAFAFGQSDHSGLIFQWQHKFNPAEQSAIKQWLANVEIAQRQLFGDLPFPVYIEVFRASQHTQEDMGEPVPWARTLRSHHRQALQFYLDMRYSDQQRMQDWTAPHEMAHLIFPYLGEKDAWLAEGFASYLQFMLMEQMGVIDSYTRQQRLIQRIQKAEQDYYASAALQSYPKNQLPAFADIAPLLRSSGDNPTMYWGGAVFFLQLDAKLKNRGGLQSVLKRYLNCCRLQTTSTPELLATLDKLSFSRLFSETYQEFYSRTGFPEYRRWFNVLYPDNP